MDQHQQNQQSMGNLNFDNYKGPWYPATVVRDKKAEIVSLPADKRDQALNDLTTNGYIACRDENGDVPFVLGFGGIQHLTENITNGVTDTGRSSSRR